MFIVKRSRLNNFSLFSIGKRLFPLSKFTSFNEKHLPNFSKKLILLGIPILTYVFLSRECRSDDWNSKFTLEECIAELKNRLLPVRKILQESGRPTPLVNVRADNNGPTETHSVELSLQFNVDIISLLIHWSSILSRNDQPIYFKAIANKSLPKSSEISLISHDQRSSISIKKYPRPAVVLFKDNGFSSNDIDNIVEGYYKSLMNSPSVPTTRESPQNDLDNNNPLFKLFDLFNDNESGNSFSIIERGGERDGRPRSRQSQKQQGMSQDPIAELESLGIRVFNKTSNESLDWDSLAGYDAVKRNIEDTILNALKHPEVYENISKQTRHQSSSGSSTSSGSSNRPKAVLLEGPPGTGKTLTARIIAHKCDKPMIHLAIENVVSKWYGDSEKTLAKVFDLCDALGGVILFVDEVDALAASRGGSSGGGGGGMHEASRRILSVLLQRLDGFEGAGHNLVVCATNRKQDLDAALLSRFDAIIKYDLPDNPTRAAVFSRYAKQLSKADYEVLAATSHDLSCRDIREICEQAERQVASAVVRKELPANALPTLDTYKESLKQRRRSYGLDPSIEL